MARRAAAVVVLSPPTAPNSASMPAEPATDPMRPTMLFVSPPIFSENRASRSRLWTPLPPIVRCSSASMWSSCACVHLPLLTTLAIRSSPCAGAERRAEERVDARGARDRADEPDNALRQAAELERETRIELARMDAGSPDRALELGLDVVELGLGPLAAGQDLRDEIFATVVIVMMAARGGLLLLLRAGAAEQVLDAVEEALYGRRACGALEEWLQEVRRERTRRNRSGNGARLSLLVARAAEKVLDSIEEAFHGRRAPGALEERLEQVRDERALGDVTART
jgi:hypothetical protein